MVSIYNVLDIVSNFDSKAFEMDENYLKSILEDYVKHINEYIPSIIEMDLTNRMQLNRTRLKSDWVKLRGVQTYYLLNNLCHNIDYYHQIITTCEEIAMQLKNLGETI